MQRIVVWILLVLAAGEFTLRGPVRYLHPTNWNDLAQYYATSRIWLRGQNFANSEYFARMWRDEVGETFSSNTPRMRTAPPLGALVIFAPIAIMPWPVAKLLWFVVLLAGFGATVGSLIGARRLDPYKPRGMLFIAGCLALAPFHTGIASGNQTILVVGLCAFGIWAAKVDCDLLAGLSFGIACSLKPHIAAFLVLYYIARQRWRLFLTAVGVTAALVLLAVAWMHFAGVNWLPDYVSNIRFGAARNKVDDFTSANQIRFTLINLQVPFYSFTQSAKSANLLAFSVGASLLLVWLVLVIRKRAVSSELLSLATVAVIGLLPLYHRLYDASVLAIPLCWCLTRPEALKRISQIALLLMAAFLLPGASVLQQAAHHGGIPDAWTHSLWWQGFVMPHQTWILLSLSVVLLYGMAKARQIQPNGSSRSNNLQLPSDPFYDERKALT